MEVHKTSKECEQCRMLLISEPFPGKGEHWEQWGWQSTRFPALRKHFSSCSQEFTALTLFNQTSNYHFSLSLEMHELHTSDSFLCSQKQVYFGKQQCGVSITRQLHFWLIFNAIMLPAVFRYCCFHCWHKKFTRPCKILLIKKKKSSPSCLCYPTQMDQLSKGSVFAGTRYREMLSERRSLNHLLLKVKDYERAKPNDEYIKPFRCLRLCIIDLKQCRCGWRRKPIEPTGPVAMTYSSQEKGFALITLAIVNFPWTGRVCQGKQHNKERMNGGMKERKVDHQEGLADNLQEWGLGTENKTER